MKIFRNVSAAIFTMFLIAFGITTIEAYAIGTGGVDSAMFKVKAQAGTLLNTEAVSADDTALAVTLGAVAGRRSHIYSVSARCEAGTASLTITDGGTAIWSTEAAEVTTVNFRTQWNTPLTGTTNSAIVITLSACGASNAGTLSIQADRY